MAEQQDNKDKPRAKTEWLLKFTTGINMGAEVLLKGERTYVIGTADDCDIILHDKGLVPHHAKLSIEQNQVMVEPIDGLVGIDKIRIRKKTPVSDFANLALQYTCCIIGPSKANWPKMVSPAFIEEEKPKQRKHKTIGKINTQIKRRMRTILSLIFLGLVVFTAIEFSVKRYEEYQQVLTSSQGQALEEAFVRNYKLLNLRLVRENFKELFLVSNYGEKKFYLTGYVKSKKRLSEAMEIVSKEAYFETVNQVLVIEEILAVMGETLAFLGYNMVKPEYDGNGDFAITGFVPAYDDVLVAERNIFQDIIGIKSLSVRVFSQKIEELTTGIHFGDKPYIADSEGNRYFEGAIIEPGVRLEKITREKLLFDYNGKIIAYQVKQLQNQRKTK